MCMFTYSKIRYIMKFIKILHKLMILIFKKKHFELIFAGHRSKEPDWKLWHFHVPQGSGGQPSGSERRTPAGTPRVQAWVQQGQTGSTENQRKSKFNTEYFSFDRQLIRMCYCLICEIIYLKIILLNKCFTYIFHGM